MSDVYKLEDLEACVSLMKAVQNEQLGTIKTLLKVPAAKRMYRELRRLRLMNEDIFGVYRPTGVRMKVQIPDGPVTEFEVSTFGGRAVAKQVTGRSHGPENTPF